MSAKLTNASGLKQFDYYWVIIMTIEKNRFFMIEQQIRPWYVSDQDVLNSLIVVKREKFFPENQQSLAFFDTELPLPDGSHALTPKLEARIIQDLEIKKQESVLLIGAGTGYLAALLGYKARQVTVLESSPELLSIAQTNLRTNDVNNVTLVAANGLVDQHEGYFDVIIIAGSVELVPEHLQQQLTLGGRLYTIVGAEPVMTAQITTRTSEKEFTTRKLFETVVQPLRQSKPLSKFKF